LGVRLDGCRWSDTIDMAVRRRLGTYDFALGMSRLNKTPNVAGAVRLALGALRCLHPGGVMIQTVDFVYLLDRAVETDQGMLLTRGDIKEVLQALAVRGGVAAAWVRRHGVRQ